MITFLGRGLWLRESVLIARGRALKHFRLTCHKICYWFCKHSAKTCYLQYSKHIWLRKLGVGVNCASTFLHVWKTWIKTQTTAQPSETTLQDPQLLLHTASLFISCYSFNRPHCTCFWEDELQNERPSSDDSWTSGKKVPVGGERDRNYSQGWFVEEEVWPYMVEQSPLAIQATSAKTPTSAGHWRTLWPLEGPEATGWWGRVKKLDERLVTKGTPAGCAPAPTWPKGPFLKYLNHLPKIPKRAIYFLHTF